MQLLQTGFRQKKRRPFQHPSFDSAFWPSFNNPSFRKTYLWAEAEAAETANLNFRSRQ